MSRPLTVFGGVSGTTNAQMITVCLLSLLLLLLLAHTAGASGIHKAFLTQTNVSCASNADCFAHYNNAWCHRGLVCLHSRCWAVPNFPCPRTEFCDEREKQCVPRVCRDWRDCDDGVYCNGQELCVAHRCVPDPNFDCTQSGYMCNEAQRRCTQPVALQADRERIRKQGTVHAANATPAPTTNGTVPVGEISTATLIWVVVGLVGFLLIVMAFWLIQQAAARRPQTVLVDRDAVNGNRVFVPEVYY